VTEPFWSTRERGGRAEAAVRETVERGLPPAARAVARLDRLRRAAGEVEAVRHRLAAAELEHRRR
jgi:hypothetical protein